MRLQAASAIIALPMTTHLRMPSTALLRAVLYLCLISAFSANDSGPPAASPPHPLGALPPAFAAWLGAHAGVGTPSDTSLAIEVHLFPGGVRGMRARRALRRDERILEISLGAAIRRETVEASAEGVGAALRAANVTLPDVGVLAIYLLAERARGDASFYAAYLRQLPDAHVSPFYSLEPLTAEEERLLCAESHATGGAGGGGGGGAGGGNAPRRGGCEELEAMYEARSALREGFESLDRSLFRRHRDVFPPQHFTLATFAWAMATVVTRAFTAGADGEKWLVPFADCFNHHNSDFHRKTSLCVYPPNATAGGGAGEGAGGGAGEGAGASPACRRRHVSYWYNASSETLSFFADQDYAKGDQVFISYGALSNRRLLRTYGFIVRRREEPFLFNVLQVRFEQYVH